MKSEFAVAADLNPGKRDTQQDVTLPTDHAAPASAMRRANSSNHARRGQNVLYADGHVAWADHPFVGCQRDNVYTVSGSEDGSAPTSATIVGSPRWRGDSVLLPVESVN